MTSIGEESVIKVSDDCLTTTVEDEVVVLNQATGAYQGIGGVGRHVWALAEEPTTVSTILAALEDEYEDPPDGWREEVIAFIDGLAEHRLIEVADGTTA